MLKMNTKKARQNAVKYLWKCAKEEDYKTPHAYIVAVAESFLKCKGYAIHKGANVQECFIEWSQGLPFRCFDFWYNKPAKTILGDILEENDGERERFTEEQAERSLGNFLFVHVFADEIFDRLGNW